MLADNIYEEDTGGLSLGKSHPELFLTMMAGLGLPARNFDNVRLLPASRRYRAWLDRVSNNRDWVVGAAALTVFVEGSVKDRAELADPSKPKTAEDIEAIVQRHPLVKYHGLSPDSMDLIRAHQMVEAGHRHDAYTMVVNYATTHTQQQTVLSCLKKCLTLWQAYRDGVSKACGLKKA
jgi:pyrroloquinoline-quinone synthase